MDFSDCCKSQTVDGSMSFYIFMKSKTTLSAPTLYKYINFKCDPRTPKAAIPQTARRWQSNTTKATLSYKYDMQWPVNTHTPSINFNKVLMDLFNHFQTSHVTSVSAASVENCRCRDVCLWGGTAGTTVEGENWTYLS